MEKITQGHPMTQSPDFVKENIETLKSLFPTIVKEGKIDWSELQALLGNDMETEDEYYRMTWAGKSMARKEANKPSTATLRPNKADSKDWDTTQNIFIEGDNLEVLKLLQKSYANKIKMIYIDPPYNTGKDFVYPDNYADNLSNYLSITGQKDESGKRTSTNTESDGRYHSNWLNMMYPRLKIARNLLASNGSIFISIDDNEISNLRKLCDEIFGNENYVAQITLLCNPKGRAQDKHFAANHEYILIYSKNPLPKGSFTIEKEKEQLEVEYQEEDDFGRYRTLELRNTHREFGKHNRKNLFYPFYADPNNGDVQLNEFENSIKILPIWNDGFEGCWTWGKPKAEEDLDFLIAKEVNGIWKIFVKDYANGAAKMLKTILIDKSYFTEKGQKAFNELFKSKKKIFQSPKSVELIIQLLKTTCADGDTVLDFFAGSGTIAHAVMQLNCDGGNRKYICIQLPEVTDEKSDAFKAGFKTISEITKERIRRAGERIKSEIPNDLFSEQNQKLDIGFKAFKLDSSNINAWDGNPENLETNLFNAGSNIKENRTEEDVLFEILLKNGLDLAQPIEQKVFAGKTVFSVGIGALFICLANGVTTEVAEGIGKWKQELDPATCKVIFKDNGFTDVEKTNSMQILKRYGIEEVNTI